MPVATALLVASAASVVNVRVAAAFRGGTPLNRAASATTAAWPRVEARTVTAMPPMLLVARTFWIAKKACGARC